MEEFEVNKILQEISVKGVIPSDKQIELFEQYKKDLANGVKAQDSVARAILIISNEKLINLCAKHVVRGYLTEEIETELLFQGKLGLIKAIDSFDPTREVTFSTFAIPCIKNKIYQYLKETIKNFNFEEIPTSELAYEDGDKPIEFEFVDDYNLDEDVFGKIDAETSRRQLFANFRYLTEPEQEVIIKYYGLFGTTPKSCLAISKIMKSAPQTAINRLNSAMEKFKLLYKKPQTAEEEKTRKKMLRSTYPLLTQIQEFLDAQFYNVASL